MIQKYHFFFIIIFFFVFISYSGNSDGERTPVQQHVSILGAGATFPAPLITAMADDYRDLTNRIVTVNY